CAEAWQQSARGVGEAIGWGFLARSTRPTTPPAPTCKAGAEGEAGELSFVARSWLSPEAVNQAVFEHSLDRLGLVDFSGELLREAAGTGDVESPVGAVA